MPLGVTRTAFSVNVAAMVLRSPRLYASEKCLCISSMAAASRVSPAIKMRGVASSRQRTKVADLNAMFPPLAVPSDNEHCLSVHDAWSVGPSKVCYRSQAVLRRLRAAGQLWANNGSHWSGVAGSDAGELTLKAGSGGINHQPFRLG